MQGREKLEEFNLYYDKYDADRVMDAMERRIARLTALVEGGKRNSVELSDMYKDRIMMAQEQIKGLEKLNDVLNAEYDLLKSVSNDEINELKKRLEDVQNTMATKNVDLGMENHKLKERIKELKHQVMTDCTCDSSKSATLRMNLYKAQEYIKELEATISKMETTTPKWISVKDRLPEGYREFDRFLICYELYVYGKKRRYSTEGYLACGVNPFGFYDNDGRFLDNAVMWCEMPLPPTTEG